MDVPPEGIIKLNANENPYGCSPPRPPGAGRGHHLNIYPDDGQQALRQRLAAYAGAPAECIVAGHGSNSLIDLVIRLLSGRATR